MIQVTKNVYVETSFRGCNLGFVTTKQGIVMVDTPMYATDAIKWREEISKKGEVRYLINTDPHRDHFTGNPFFSGVIIAHEGYREAMLEMPIDNIVELVKRMDPEGLPLMEGYQRRLPDITFDGTLNLHLGDHTFELIHLPGHTANLSGVHIPEEQVIFVSDCIFYRTKTYLHDSLPNQWLESLRKVGKLNVDAIIVPGHGDDVCKKEYLEEQANIIQQWVSAVETAIEQGLKEDEAVDKIVCPDPYPLPKGSSMSEFEVNRMIIHRLYHILDSRV